MTGAAGSGIVGCNMRICLVVGHSEKKQGAINKDTGLTEYVYNSALAHAIRGQLRVNCPKCDPFIQHRTGSYQKLIDDINAEKPDIIISLHCNAYNTEVQGGEVLYSGSASGLELAKAVHDKIVLSLAVSANRGIKKVDISGRGGKLLHKTKAPCVIVEPFFIDNNGDCALGCRFMLDLAEAVSSGIMNLL